MKMRQEKYIFQHKFQTLHIGMVHLTINEAE